MQCAEVSAMLHAADLRDVVATINVKLCLGSQARA